jgi:hypothetical protein
MYDLGFHTSSIGRVLAVSSILTILGMTNCATLTPAKQAEEMERLQCDRDTSNGKDVRLAESMSVLAVNPVYSYMHNGRTGTDRRIKGVKLLVRVPESVSSSLLLRSLQCHCARMTLGYEPLTSLANDPFWLPNAWVDIESTPQGGNLEVTIATDGIDGNLRLLSIAKAFAAAHAPRLSSGS